MVMVTVFSLLWGALILYDINSYSSNLFLSYGQQQLEQTKQILATAQKLNTETGISIDKNLIELINENYQTSAGNYPLVAVNGNLLYVKDDSFTKDIVKDETVSLAKYLNEKTDTLIGNTEEDNTSIYKLEEGKPYLISLAHIEAGGNTYTVGIAASEKYIYQILDTKLLRIHILFYISVSACLFISVSFLLIRKLKHKDKQINYLETESANNRQVIDRLNEDIFKVSNINKNSLQYGFLSKEIVKEILNNLTFEQLNASISIKVDIDSLDSELIANVAALLCKLQVEKSISCMWGEREFKIILLNATMQEALQFLQLFHNRYQVYYGEIPEEIRINTEGGDVERQVIYGV